jgi:glycerophosphoryl diester phosphodiesterase
VIVSSFQVSSLLAVRAADSRLALGALWGYLTDPAAGLAAAVEAGWRAVHPNIGAVTASLVEEAHRAGLAVNAWTVNTVPDLTRCVDLGVDTVITDQLGEALVIARGHQP